MPHVPARWQSGGGLGSRATGYCANVAMKPTLGALHGGEGLGKPTARRRSRSIARGYVDGRL